MSKYIHKFSTLQDRNDYILSTGFTKPFVSTHGGVVVSYNKEADDYQRDYYTQQPLTFKITSPGYIIWNGEGITIEYKKNNEEWSSITSEPVEFYSTQITVSGKSGTYIYGGYDSQQRMDYWENGDDKLYYWGKYLKPGDSVYDSTYENEYKVLTSQYDILPNENTVNLVSVVSGDVVQFRGNNAKYEGNNFSSTCNFNVEGNIMSLIDSTGYTTATTLSSADTFYYLFKNCAGLTSAENLILPATTLTSGCYRSMFENCTSLTTAPELPATTLANYCYQCMFRRCTSLTTAPELPATTLANNCYYQMFNGCTSLTTAPELPATTLAGSCYYEMFYDCTNLNYIKCLATNISASNCTNGWVVRVASTGTFVKAPSMTGWTTGRNGIPSGWVVEDNH